MYYGTFVQLKRFDSTNNDLLSDKTQTHASFVLFYFPMTHNDFTAVFISRFETRSRKIPFYASIVK